MARIDLTKKINPRDLKPGFYENTQTNEKVRLHQINDETKIYTPDGKCFALNPKDIEKYKPLFKQNKHPFNEWGKDPLPFS